MFDIQYNDMKSSELKVYVKEYPSIAPAKKIYEEVEVQGKKYLRDTGFFESTQIDIQMNYIGDEKRWHESWRKIQSWLSATNSELILQDDPNYYFKILRVELSENLRKGRGIGDFTASFVTKDGLYYFKEGKWEYSIEEVAWNPGEISCPDYVISGTGKCIIKVNEQDFEVTVNGSVIVDTERYLIYDTDHTIINNMGKGDYKGLWLKKGHNDISVTNGFDLKIIPHWRCL